MSGGTEKHLKKEIQMPTNDVKIWGSEAAMVTG